MVNSDQQMFHGKSDVLHDEDKARIKRLRRYSDGSKLGRSRKAKAIRYRVSAMAHREAREK